MLEIIGIAILASINGKNAAARGQKPLKYQLLTVALWLGAEFLGGILGGAMSGGEMGPTYILALLCAAGGGVASYFIAKNAKAGAYLPANYGVPAGATPLAAPTTLTIVRKKNPVAMLVTYTAFVNGVEVGKFKNGESRQLPLTLNRNSFLVKDGYGNQQTPLIFTPTSTNPTIVFNSQSTVRGECVGVAFETQVPLPASGQMPSTQMMGPSATAEQEPAKPVLQVAPPGERGASGLGAATTSESKTNPMLAVYVLAGTVILMLLTMIISWRGNMRAFDSISQYLNLSFIVVLAVSIYLLLENDIKYKLIAGGGLLLGALLRSLAYVYLMAFAQLLQRPRLGIVIGNATFGINLRNSFITIIVTAAVALLVAAKHQGSKPKKLLFAAGISAGITFIIGLVNLRYALMAPSLTATMKFGFLFNQVAVALCLVFFVLLIAWICRIYRQSILPSKGARIWFGVCAALTTIAAIANLATATMGINGFVITLLGVGGYVLLFLNKRVGFPVVLWAVTMTVVAGMCVGFNGRIPSVGLGLAPVLGFLNPLITWFVIRGVWGDFDLMDGGEPSTPMPGYHPAPVGEVPPAPVTPVPIVPVAQPVAPADESEGGIDKIAEGQGTPPLKHSALAKTEVAETDEYAMPEDIIKRGKSELGDEEGMDYLLSFNPEVPHWDAKDRGHYYYALARKAERLGYEEAATAFNVAQCIAFLDKGTLGYKRLAQAGYEMSPGALAALQEQYPLPTSRDEVSNYQSRGLAEADKDPFANEEGPPSTAVETAPEVIPEAEPEPEAVTADPTSMTAAELIDFMITPAAEAMGLASLGSTLLYKLQDNFYTRPQDVEKTLRTFGDESMVSRFNMIKNTMKPSDLELLIPDLLYKYTMARR